MYCKNCGAQIDDHSRFCSHCGARQRPFDGTEGAPRREDGHGAEGAFGREGVPQWEEGPGAEGASRREEASRRDSPDGPAQKQEQGFGRKFPMWILYALLFLVGIMLMAVVIPTALMALTGSAG